MKYIIAVILVIIFYHKSVAQVTSIPDPAFEQVLLDLGIDSDQLLNGQILTSDALNVTNLIISPSSVSNYPYPPAGSNDGFIHDLSGIEAFENLQHLTVQVTMAEQINLSTLSNLLYLDCADNMLTSLDVSNNTLLEYLDISSGGDVVPFNDFTEINLSSNPNIHTLKASGVSRINLHNNSNSPNMFINVGCNYCYDYPADYVHGNVCIEVVNVNLAQSNQYPYSEWVIYNAYMTYSYTDDIIQCSLNVNDLSRISFKLYPNPVEDILMISTQDDTVIDRVVVYDIAGRKILEQNNVVDNINISHLEAGNYFLKVFTNRGSRSEKFIIK